MPKPATVASFAEVSTPASSLATVQERKRREQIRWIGLQHIDTARPEQMTDAALLPLVQAVYPSAGIRELRRELDYLMACELLTIVQDYENWRLKLTRHGIDLVQYTTPCPAGIGRPNLPE